MFKNDEQFVIYFGASLYILNEWELAKFGSLNPILTFL